MKTPTPIHQLPSFNTGGNLFSQSGINKWVPYLIVGGVIVIAIVASIAVNKKVQRDLMNLKIYDENKSE